MRSIRLSIGYLFHGNLFGSAPHYTQNGRVTLKRLAEVVIKANLSPVLARVPLKDSPDGIILDMSNTVTDLEISHAAPSATSRYAARCRRPRT